MTKQSHDPLLRLLALGLFSLFAGCILLVLISGAGAYRRLTTRDDAAYTQRTAAQYLAARVHRADAAGQVLAGSFDAPGTGQGDTLFFAEELEGSTYYTRVYCWDGQLRELFSAADLPLSPQDGQPLLEMDGLQARPEGPLLTLWITQTDGSQQQLTLCLRSGEVQP